MPEGCHEAGGRPLFGDGHGDHARGGIRQPLDGGEGGRVGMQMLSFACFWIFLIFFIACLHFWSFFGLF